MKSHSSCLKSILCYINHGIKFFSHSLLLLSFLFNFLADKTKFIYIRHSKYCMYIDTHVCHKTLCISSFEDYVTTGFPESPQDVLENKEEEKEPAGKASKSHWDRGRRIFPSGVGHLSAQPVPPHPGINPHVCGTCLYLVTTLSFMFWPTSSDWEGNLLNCFMSQNKKRALFCHRRKTLRIN